MEENEKSPLLKNKGTDSKKSKESNTKEKETSREKSGPSKESDEEKGDIRRDNGEDKVKKGKVVHRTGGLHRMLRTETSRPPDIEFDSSLFCCCDWNRSRQRDAEEGDHSTHHNEGLHQRYLVHVLCTVIMGADVTLDILQVHDYGQYGDKTHDLFVASLAIMSIVPTGLAIATACFASYSLLLMIYDFFIGKDNFQWGFFFGMFIWCIGGVLAPLVVGTFAVTLFLSFPLMVCAVVATPAYGLYVAWRNMYSINQFRLYYFIRYTQGLVCAFPHFIIDVIFMHRMGAHSAQAVASAVFSAVSVCQVCYQAFGLKRFICRCRATTCVSMDGYGTLMDVIEGNSVIEEHENKPQCTCCEQKPV